MLESRQMPPDLPVEPQHSQVDPQRLAEEVSALFSHSRLRLAREYKRWKQTDLARAVDLTPAAISQFEKANGNRPSANTLLRMATALGFPLRFFAVQSAPSSREFGPELELGAFFRSLRSFSATDRRGALTVTQCVRDMTYALEARVRLPVFSAPRVPVTATAEPEAPEGAAAAVRREWDLGDGPLANVLSMLEQHGIVCVRYSLGQHSVDAFSVPFSPHPVVVLGGDKDKSERDRFTGSHELGHLVMHKLEDAGTKVVEAQAHRFAGALLMPLEAGQALLKPRADFRYLVSLKREWGMSIGALLRRSKDVGVMTDTSYVQAVKFMSMKGWTKQEPGDRGQTESPSLLASAMLLASKDGDALRDVADFTGWPHQLVSDLVSQSQDVRPTIQW